MVDSSFMTGNTLQALSGKTIVILGYGNQGRAHALNLRDSGLDVKICTRDAGIAIEDGFEIIEPKKAAAADLLIIALPDEVHKSYFESYLHWISSMINHSKSDVNDNINLIETNQFSTFDNEMPKNGVVITKKLSGTKNFENLIFNSQANESFEVLEEMSDYKKLKNQSGIGVFVSSLYNACRSLGAK